MWEKQFLEKIKVKFFSLMFKLVTKKVIVKKKIFAVLPSLMLKLYFRVLKTRKLCSICLEKLKRNLVVLFRCKCL